MKRFLISLIISSTLTTPTAHAADSSFDITADNIASNTHNNRAANFNQASWDQKISAFTKMSGRSFEYSVAGYRIRLRFNGEESIAWERLEAPDGTAGRKSTQIIDRQNIHPGIFLMAWSEQDGQRFQARAKLHELN